MHIFRNDAIYSVLKSEILELKAKVYRIVLLGDFNAHVGDSVEEGVVGNNPIVNANGRRFLQFLRDTNCRHVNGDSKLTQGIWTRQSGISSSVIDYAVVSSSR